MTATGRESAAGCARCGWALLAGERYCTRCGCRRPDARDHVELSAFGVAGVSDRGLHHPRNEDALCTRVLSAESDGITATIAVLSDGVSRAAHPDLAAGAAAETGAAALAGALRVHRIPSLPEIEVAVRRAAAAAHEAVVRLARVELAGRTGRPGALACTFIAAVVHRGSIIVGWVGDSRAYWLPVEAHRAATQLTEDDSWSVQEVAAGRMSPAEAETDPTAHTLTAWLGSDRPNPEVHLTRLVPDSAGTLVLCSDGLSRHLPSPEAIRAALRHDPAVDPLPAARDLVEAALGCGGEDNVTVAVLPLGRPSATPAARAPSLRGEVRQQLLLPAGRTDVEAVIAVAPDHPADMPMTPVGIGLEIWTPVGTSLLAIARTAPDRLDLTDRQTRVDGRFSRVPLGRWTGAPQEYLVRLRTVPGAPGRERLCCRATFVGWPAGDAGRPLAQRIVRDRPGGIRESHPAALICAIWTREADPGTVRLRTADAPSAAR